MILPVATPAPKWQGTQDESMRLIDAIAHNCDCEFGLMGVRLSTCPPHLMMLHDQRALDGLLFVRRTSARFTKEEWNGKPLPKDFP